MPLSDQYYNWSIHLTAVLFAVLGFAALPGNIVVMWLTLRRTELRTVRANWYIFNLALSDFTFCLMNISQSVFIYHHTDAPLLCSFVGFMVTVSATVSVFMAAFIALNRYVYLCKPGDGLAYDRWFSSGKVLLMIFISWFLVAALIAPLLEFGKIGASPVGYCGISTGENISQFLYANASIMAAMGFAYVTVIVCYNKLTQWINDKLRSLSISPNAHIRNTVKETQNLLRMLKILCLLPLVVQNPALIMDIILHTSLKHSVPIFMIRFTIALFPVISFVNPWLTLFLIRPYRAALSTTWLKRFLPTVLIAGQWNVRVVPMEPTGRGSMYVSRNSKHVSVPTHAKSADVH